MCELLFEWRGHCSLIVPLTYRNPTPLALPQLIHASHGGWLDKDKELESSPQVSRGCVRVRLMNRYEDERLADHRPRRRVLRPADGYLRETYRNLIIIIIITIILSF